MQALGFPRVCMQDLVFIVVVVVVIVGFPLLLLIMSLNHVSFSIEQKQFSI